MAKHPGDDGKWNLNAVDPVPMTIRERLDTLLTPASPGVVRAMEQEEEFLRNIPPFTTKRFTDRRDIPGRDRVKPSGPDRKGPR
jgi:hypothetical protein